MCVCIAMSVTHASKYTQYCGEPRWPRGSGLASYLQGLNFESCVWRAVSSQSSRQPQGVLLAQFSLYVHKSGLKPDSFYFISFSPTYTHLETQKRLITGGSTHFHSVFTLILCSYVALLLVCDVISVRFDFF